MADRENRTDPADALCLREGERLDDLQNGYRILQSEELFCFGIDAVLLSGFAKIRRGERVCDLGCGNGILPILLAAKTESGHFTGIELQAESADLAVRSIQLNGLESRITILQGDLKDAAKLLGYGSMDAVVSNPPYMNSDHGKTSPNRHLEIARHEICCTFADVADAAAALLHPGGRLFLVHRPFRLAEVISGLRDVRLEPKRMRFVHPYVDREPNLVLIESQKEAKPGLQVERPLVVYEAPGQYTEETLAFYGKT